MDATDIWYLTLKGCVLQELYPSYDMRQMADNDILFDAERADDVRDIMGALGFMCEIFDKGNHDVCHKEPVCNFEMHRALFGIANERTVRAYYENVERLLLTDGLGGFGMRLSDEDLYVYLVAHEYKHFAGSGTGLRSLLDTFVWLRAKGLEMDWELWHCHTLCRQPSGPLRSSRLSRAAGVPSSGDHVYALSRAWPGSRTSADVLGVSDCLGVRQQAAHGGPAAEGGILVVTVIVISTYID